MRDYILLSGQTDLFELPVLGERGQCALHGADFVDVVHLQEKIQELCLFVAVQRTVSLIRTGEKLRGADDVGHRRKGIQA